MAKRNPDDPLPAEETVHICGGCGRDALGERPGCDLFEPTKPHLDPPKLGYPLPAWVQWNKDHPHSAHRAHAGKFGG